MTNPRRFEEPRFLDLEGTREARVDAPAIKDAYLEEFTRWRDGMESQAQRHGLDYLVVRTDEAPAQVLLRMLLPRKRLE